MSGSVCPPRTRHADRLERRQLDLADRADPEATNRWIRLAALSVVPFARPLTR